MERKVTRQRRYSPRAPLGRKFYEERVFHGNAPFRSEARPGLGPRSREPVILTGRIEGSGAAADAQKIPWWLAMKK